MSNADLRLKLFGEGGIEVGSRLIGRGVGDIKKNVEFTVTTIEPVSPVQRRLTLSYSSPWSDYKKVHIVTTPKRGGPLRKFLGETFVPAGS